MSAFLDFFPDKIQQPEMREKVISSRFPAFKAITCDEAEMSRIRKSCSRTVKGKKGAPDTKEIDTEALTRSMILACVKYPDFADTELQQAWGVMGAESLIGKMFLPGEFAELSSWIHELMGFAAEELEGNIETAKN